MPEGRRENPASNDDWQAGWESNRPRVIRAAFAATPAQRLAWLEEMIELAHRTGALPRRPKA